MTAFDVNSRAPAKHLLKPMVLSPLCSIMSIGLNKNISVFCVKGLKILDGVGTHVVFFINFFWKKILFYAF